MYQSIGISTNLNDYDIDDKVIENITSALKKHGMTAIGENGTITLEKVAQILTMAMK
jgi:NADP-dependent alcohol dehydrogenase